MNEPETTEPVKRKPGRPPKVKVDDIAAAVNIPELPVDPPTLPVIPPPQEQRYNPLGWAIEQLTGTIADKLEEGEQLKKTVAQFPTSIEKNAVAQVFNAEDPFYGVLFTVGDVRKDQVHGFFIVPGEEKRFVTTKIESVRLVGKAHVGSRNPCSADWLEVQSREIVSQETTQ